MIVPTDASAEDYCCNTINDYNDRSKTSYLIAEAEHSKVIAYRNGNTDNIIRFITPNGGSVYRVPKGKSFHCVDPHAKRDFTNRDLHHIAAESGEFDIADSNGKRTNKAPKFEFKWEKVRESQGIIFLEARKNPANALTWHKKGILFTISAIHITRDYRTKFML